MTLEFTGSKPLIHHVYTDMITPLENLDKAGEAYPEKDLRKDKERYVTALVNYPCKEEIRMMTLRWYPELENKLYKLPLETLKTIHAHLHSIFNNTYPNEVREDIIANLLKVDSNEWENILIQAKYITANLHRGPDFGFAIGILCNLNKKPTEFRDLVINTANSLFDWRDDSKIRVRIFASVANLSQSELETISKDEEKKAELVDKVNSDRKVEAKIRI